MLKLCSKFNVLNPIFCILFSIFYFLFCFNALAAEVFYTDGTLLKGSGPEVFVLENGMKRHILNPEVFNGLNYDWGKIIQVQESILKKYPLRESLSSFKNFPNGTLVRGSGPEIYLIKSNYKYWIPDPETFNNLELRWQNVINISDDILKKIREGKSLEPKKSKLEHPETFILGNPPVFFETDEITFKFSGRPVSGERSDLTFETFVEGYDKDWKATSSDERKLSLPKEGASYTFFVRAKEGKDDYDLSPSPHSFQVNLSPYFEKINIESKNIKKSKAEEEYLALYNKSNDTIDIAGWSLCAQEENRKYKLPENYDNPNIDFQDDFKISQGDRVYVFTGKTPVNWKSFRLNKCVGYLNNIANFYLSLPEECPDPADEDLSELSLDCREFIEDLKQCEVPEDLKLFGLEISCQNYIRENINYAFCVKNHKDELDFFEKTWYAYLGQSSAIWDDSKDTITLRDEDGLKVSEYSY